MVSARRFAWLSDFVLVGALLALVGCSGGLNRPTGTHVPFSLPSELMNDSWILENPCGFLRVERPLINVSGLVNTAVRPGTEAVLFIVRNTSLDTALFTVENCHPLMTVPVDSAKDFTFPHLPAGEYVVMLPRGAFGEVQGFPIIPSAKMAGLVATTVWHGGDYRYSMAAFTVRPYDSKIEVANSS